MSSKNMDYMLKSLVNVIKNRTDNCTCIQTDAYLYIAFNIQITSCIMILVSVRFCPTCKQTDKASCTQINLLIHFSVGVCLLCEEIRHWGPCTRYLKCVSCSPVSISWVRWFLSYLTWPFVVWDFTNFPQLSLRVVAIWQLHHHLSLKHHCCFWAYSYPLVFSEPISSWMLFFISCSSPRHFFYHDTELYCTFPAGGDALSNLPWLPSAVRFLKRFLSLNPSLWACICSLHFKCKPSFVIHLNLSFFN